MIRESTKALLRCTLAAVVAGNSTSADRIVLQDGFELFGQINIDDSQITVRTDLRTYYVSAKQLQASEPSEGIEAEVFLFDQPTSKNGRRVVSLTRVLRTEPFDKFGRRTVMAEDARQREVAIHQAITEIHPSHVVVDGINFAWRSLWHLSEIPKEEIVAVLRHATPESLEGHLKLAQWFLQARYLKEARDELDLIRTRFPDGASRADEVGERLSLAFSEDGLITARRFIQSHQWAKASDIIAQMKKIGVPTNHRPQWEELDQKATELFTKIDRAKTLIRECLESSELTPSEPMKHVAEEILDLVNPATIDRLQPLLALADQPNMTARERLSMATSGWSAGANLSVPSWDEAQQLCKKRQRLIALWEAPSEEAFEVALDAATTEELDGNLAMQMLPLLPAPPTKMPEDGMAATYAARTANGDEVPYLVQLPSSYDRATPRPMIMALHGSHSSPKAAIDFWKNLAESWGMIVVAPRFLSEGKLAYEYSLEEHERYLAVLADARRRLAVDSNRVILTGHDVGAFAAFDLGMSHPDDLAALVCVSGVPMFYAQYTWRNVSGLPIYAVEGELNGNNVAAIRSHFGRFFSQGHNAVFVEYQGRGAGSFGGELPRIGEWLARKVRDPFPKQVKAASARHSDRRFYWVEIDSFAENATIPPALFDKKKGVKPARIEAELTLGNTLQIEANGIESLNVHLSPPLVQLDDPSLAVKINKRVVHEGAVQPDLGTILREARRTGDRQRLVAKTLSAKL